MISYQELAEKPRVFKSITGLDIEEFEQLFGKLVPVWVAEERKWEPTAHRRRFWRPFYVRVTDSTS